MVESKPSAVRRARTLRRVQTKHEGLLWGKLRDRRLAGHKFVRQMPIGPYFADFVCREAKLIIEIDGGQHAGNARDERRDHFLMNNGYRVLRFWNEDVTRQIGDVLDTILAAVNGRLETYDRFKVPSSASSRHLLPGGEKERVDADHAALVVETLAQRAG